MKEKMRRFGMGVVVLALAAFSAPSRADGVTQAQIDALQQQINRLQSAANQNGGATSASSSNRWAGAYVGADLGLANTAYTFNDIDFQTSYGPTTRAVFSFMPDVKAGYNWQRGAGVFGIEGDFDPNFAARTSHDVNTVSGHDYNYMGDNERAFTLRGRFGLAVDQALLYLTVGGIYAQGNQTWTHSDSSGATVWQWNTWNMGLVAGAGMDYALTDHVSLDFLYTNSWFAPKTVVESNTPQGVGPYRYNMSMSFQVVKIGASYKF